MGDLGQASILLGRPAKNTETSRGPRRVVNQRGAFQPFFELEHVAGAPAELFPFAGRGVVEVPALARAPAVVFDHDRNRRLAPAFPRVPPYCRLETDTAVELDLAGGEGRCQGAEA